MYKKLNFYTGATQGSKDSLVQKEMEQLGKERKLQAMPHTICKNNLKMHCVKPKGIILLEENAGENICDLGLGKAFYRYPIFPKAPSIKE